MSFSGIRITRSGSDVRDAADYQYSFNSDWPSLQIVYDKQIDVTYTGTTVVVKHNLGFVPFVLPFKGQVINDYSAFSWDKTNFYFTASASLDIKCFNIDITKNVTYPLITIPDNIKVDGYDKNYGIKVTKYGKNIKSDDLRDFILHSRGQSPAQLTVLTSTTGLITYTNPAGYSPMSFGFYQLPDSSWSGLNATTPAFQRYPYLFSFASPYDGYNNYYGCKVISGSAPYGVSIVVLRDPLLSINTSTVFY